MRQKGDIYDSLVITKEETYVMRRLSLSEFHVLSVLDKPVKESLPELEVKLFEGDNYIYLVDMTENKFYAEYLIKNEFNDLYVIHSEMNTAINQTAREIELSVNQKLTNYSTTEEMNAAIKLLADKITSEVNKKVNEEELGTKIEQNWEYIKYAWNQISQYLQMEGDDGRASLNIYNGDKNKLMSLNQEGLDFYMSVINSLLGHIRDSEVCKR